MGILADLPGPKIRCSPFGNVPADLVHGAVVTLTGPGSQSSAAEIGIDHEGIIELAREILTEQSKDLTVALFLSDGIHRARVGAHPALVTEMDEVISRSWKLLLI